MHSYRFSIVQELKPPDHAQRVTFCNRILHLTHLGHDIGMFDNFFYRAEAWFHLGDFINALNYRIWYQENSYEYWESSLHPPKIGVWCAMSHRRIIGPIFYETTVNGEVYWDIITDFIALLEEDECDCVFQEAGAAHTRRMGRLSFYVNSSGERRVSLPLWVPKSPDVTPLDFFLWGHE